MPQDRDASRLLAINRWPSSEKTTFVTHRRALKSHTCSEGGPDFCAVGLDHGAWRRRNSFRLSGARMLTSVFPSLIRDHGSAIASQGPFTVEALSTTNVPCVTGQESRTAL